MDTVFTQESLGACIDQTLLKPHASKEEIRTFIEHSKEYPFHSIMVHSAMVSFCKPLLEDSGILLGCVAGFPLGQSTIEVKQLEARQALEQGADEIDYVIQLGEWKSGNVSYIEEEMAAMVTLCRGYQATSKVILETCYLTDSEKRQLCEIAKNIGPDYIKTSTGFGTKGATAEDITLMQTCTGNQIKIKASGGIRDLQTLLQMRSAGAHRIGTSAGIPIMKAYQEKVFV